MIIVRTSIAVITRLGCVRACSCRCGTFVNGTGIAIIAVYAGVKRVVGLKDTVAGGGFANLDTVTRVPILAGLGGVYALAIDGVARIDGTLW